jgi:hypothetical protein
MTKDEVLKLALESLTHCVDAIKERGLNGNPEFAEKWGLKLPLDRAAEAITAIKQALAAPVQEPDTYGYAKRLAEAIWKKHYKSIAPQWKPFDHLIGVLTQIDNMTSELTTPPAAPVQEPVKLRRGDVLRCIETDELCTVWATSTTHKTLVKWGGNDFSDYTAEQIGELFWLESESEDVEIAAEQSDNYAAFHAGVRFARAHTPPAAPVQEPVTILPDGSAFGVISFPLPSDHWLYAPNEYRDGEYEPIDLPKPILTHALRESVVAAVRYAVRGATMQGQETDFDPDALVQNAVYALCGPYTTPPAAQPAPVQEPVHPDWKSEYQKAVELHCMTLDELREADAWIKNLEKLMADQDVMLTRQAARIVDLQTHIDNFDGEDR